jgi:predicted HicB family RNase H-like nuclease
VDRVVSRDSTYKKLTDVIVTVPIYRELHKRLRIRAINEGMTIKAYVTRLIEKELRD